MFGAGLGFVFACCILVRLPIALEPHTLAAVLPLALCGLWFRHSRVVAGFALGIALTAGAIDHDLGLRLKGFSATTGMTGRICSLPVVRDGFTRFMYCPTGGSPGGARYRLSWYRPAVELLPGQEWRLAVKLGPPTGSVNFDLFDFERWQFVKRIHGRGYVRTDQKPEFIGLDGEFVDRVRFHLRENLRRRVPASELGTFLALALGDTSLLDANRWEVLNSTGTTHLLIVSGLHTGLIATLVFNLLRLIGVPLSILIGATIGITGCYALIAGWGLPVQRALIMTTTVLLCIGAARQIKPGAQVLVALVAVLGFDPLASLSNGFWLSFGAVLALLYGLHGRTGMTGGVAEWIQSTTKAQWVVFVALMPGLAHLMGQLPLGSLLTNLIAIPWVGLLLVPVLFLGLVLLYVLPSIGAFILQIVSWQVFLLWQFLDRGAGMALTQPTSEPDLLVTLWAVAGVLVLIAPRGLVPRWPALLCIVLLLKPATRLNQDSMRLTFLDVGQGLSVLIETPSSTVLYDTGPAFGDRFSAAKQIVLPTLRIKGRAQVDRLILSHSDNDHAGGLDDLLSGIGVRRLVDHQHCADEWTVDGVQFVVFTAYPDGGIANNGSCLMYVRFGRHRILLTGDIEEPAEYAILELNLGPLTLMSSPHHGSETSSTPALLNNLLPEVIVISAGYQNRFGHPSSRVLERYNNRAIRVLNTADEGGVEFEFNRTGYRSRSARRSQGALWRRTGDN